MMFSHFPNMIFFEILIFIYGTQRLFQKQSKTFLIQFMHPQERICAGYDYNK